MVVVCGLGFEAGVVVLLGFGVAAGLVVPGVVFVTPGVVALGFGVVAAALGVVAPGLVVVAPICGVVLPEAGVHGLLDVLVPEFVVAADPEVEVEDDELAEGLALVPVAVPGVLGLVVVGGAPAEAIVPGAAAEAEAPTLALGVQGAVVIDEGVVVLEGNVVVGVVPGVVLGVVVPLCVPVVGELPGSDVVPLFGNVPCGVPGDGVPGDGVMVPLLGMVVVGVEVCGAVVPGADCVPAPVACAAASAVANSGAAKKISVLRMFPPTCRFLSWMRRATARWFPYRFSRNEKGFLGWVVGFEPTTAGATVRSSTTELYPP